MRKFRWGILATGDIAESMAEALNSVEEAEILAVASRSQGSAERFGKRWNIPRCYADYTALAADPDIDIVYIATPHNLHYENMLMCLEAGKHVLCEKPLTLNEKEAVECIRLAREKELFLMEAVWMRFFPAIQRLVEWVQLGKIGQIRLIQADFCFNLPYDPTHRLYAPELGGSALLDLGIYPLSFTTMLLGFPSEVYGQAILGETGVDELNALTLVFGQDQLAQLTSSMRVEKPREAFVVGSEGYIKIHDPFFFPDRLTLSVNDGEPQTIPIPYQGNGYVHEVEEVHTCLRAGKTESEIMPLHETQKLMRLMDDLRARWGVVFPCER